MARVKRGVTAHAKHKKVLKAAKGYYGRRKNTIRIAKQAVEKANQYAYRDRKRRKRTFRALVDPAPQRRGAPVRPELQPLHRRPEQGRHHDRPQGAFRPRDPRAGGVRGDRRPGQVGARVLAWSSSHVVHDRQAGALMRLCSAWRATIAGRTKICTASPTGCPTTSGGANAARSSARSTRRSATFCGATRSG